MALDKTFFADEDFQDGLIHTLLYDLPALRQLAPLLHENDFKPLEGMRWGRPRWIVAGRILEYYSNNHEILGNMLRSECLAHAAEDQLGSRVIAELERYVGHIKKLEPKGIRVTVDRVLQYKRERLKAEALDELLDLNEAGQLTDEKMYEICMRACGASLNGWQSTDYYEQVDERIARRLRKESYDPIPLFHIGPLDAQVRGIGPGSLGLALAPTKRGKTLFLLHLACAFTLQRLRTGYFTLEDPLVEIENNLDARISMLRAKDLGDKPNLFRRRFKLFRRLVRKNLLLFDGTEEGLSVPKIEEIYLRERDRGRRMDAVLIDYDDEIRPSTSRKERRFEFADIYRDLRRFAAKHNTIVWTAAQTKRGTANKKIIEGDDVAEDISKIRKCTMTLSLGKGDWGEDSTYLHVVAHKFDRGHVGCNIMMDKERKMFYDAEATARKMLEEGEDDGEEE